MGHMRRREFVRWLGCAATAAIGPRAARAQRPAIPIIGYVSSGTALGFASLVAAFRNGLNEAGYVEDRNVTIEFRWSGGQDQQLPEFVADLIRRQVSVIVATGGSAPAIAAKAISATIPIVFTGGQDPVKLGLVQSLSRPGGNATGVLNIAPVLTAKRLELLRELVPTAEVVAVLVNPKATGSDEQLTELKAAAGSLGQKIEVFPASSEGEFDFELCRDGKTENWSALYRRRSIFYHPGFAPGFTCRTTRDTGELFVSHLCRGGWSDDLRSQFGRSASTGRCLRGPHTQGRQAGRSSGVATHQV